MKSLILILSILLYSCQKEDVKPDIQKTKVFSYDGRNIVDRIITLNGNDAKPPFNVKQGDNVKVLFACQVTTPQKNELFIEIFEDGVKVDGCANCYKFEKQFNY